MVTKFLLRCLVLPASLSLGLTACGGDVYVDAPVLEAVGINLNEKPEDQDVPERAGIVLPPSTDKLPEPGEKKTATAPAQNWPKDADLAKQEKAEQEAAAREEYCREGEWDNANIDEFNKNLGDEQRCQSRLTESISKALGGGPADEQE